MVVALPIYANKHDRELMMVVVVAAGISLPHPGDHTLQLSPATDP
jgi:hypothetical protein